jgi:hypothetical protein
VKNKKLLLFFGSGRTGSTLLGQILNYHPQCLVANEYRFLQKIIVENANVDDEIRGMEAIALKQFKSGLESADRFRGTIAHYQPKWVSMGHLASDPDFAKQKDICVIGDKKAGGNTEIYLKHPEAVIRFLTNKNENNPVFLIQVVRHPLHTALSLMKSHSIPTFDQACEHIVMRAQVAYSLLERLPCQRIRVHYEELAQSPEREIRRIVDWLGLESSTNWLSKIAKVISSLDPIRSIPEERLSAVRAILRKYQATDVFQKYCLIDLSPRSSAE